MASSIRHLLALSILPRLECRTYRTDSDYAHNIQQLVREQSVGGFVAFDGSIEDAKTVITELQDLAHGTLLFACDCEDGVTMRFSGGTEFPSMMALGHANDPSTTYSVARSIAREMRQLGIGWNFAPVADLNTNPDNPIINIRSFGSEPDNIRNHLQAYITGTQDGGVVATAKHFPGHGDTAVDSHRDMPVLNFSLSRLKSIELAPFSASVSHGVKSVMTSHIAVPELDPDGTPASLSEKMITGLLREQMGFTGVVVTDAMDMHAITKQYSNGEAAVKAYIAGNDVLETMPDPVVALDALLEAAKSGRIDRQRIRTSAKRISELKKWVDSFKDMPGIRSNGMHSNIALEAARRSVEAHGKLSSLKHPVLVLCLTDIPDHPKVHEWTEYLNQSKIFQEYTVRTVAPDPEDTVRNEVLALIEGSEAVIIGLFVKPRGFAGTVGLNPVQYQLVQSALQSSQSVIMNFGNPYLLRKEHPGVRIDTFSSSSASLAVSVEALSRCTR